MTSQLSTLKLGQLLESKFPGAVAEATESNLFLTADRVLDICRFLHDDEAMSFDLLSQITSVDRLDHFEVLYRLVSTKHNHSVVVKARAQGREEPTVPSVYSVWRGANFQEREVYDLMGVRFSGHPNLRRILTWDGFEGHPLRKDFILQRP